MLREGQIIGGDFRVVRLLGEGGMGAVFVAEQLSTGATRALKIVHPSVVGEPTLKERFAQEARVGARIDSDHIVQVVAAGVDGPSGMPWMAMELLDGVELAKAIETSGPYTPAQVRDVFAQLCHAVGAAHAAGIVHRDLKPENIFLARSRRQGQSFMVKVLDFGIAKILDMARSKMTGAMGSPLWMSPEQTKASDAVTPATDVWALGLIAFYMLTRRSYWISGNADGGTAAVLREVVFEPLVPASLRAQQLGVGPLPPGFDAWFARCVNREPSQRYPNASACLAGLEPVLSAPAPPQVGRTSFAEPLQTSLTGGGQPARGSWPDPNLQPATYQAGAQAVTGYGATSMGSAVGHNTVASLPLGARDFAAPLQQSVGIPPPPGATGVGARTVPRAPGKSSRGFPIVGVLAGVLGVGLVGLVLFASGVFGTKPSKKKKKDATVASAEAEKKDPVSACAKAFADFATAKDAAPACKTECEGGDEGACQRWVLSSERASADASTVASAQRGRCDAGKPGGCTLAGSIDERKSDVSSFVTALSLYEKGCDGGDALGCVYAAAMLLEGRGAARSADKASQHIAKGAPKLEAACSKTDGLECVALGWLSEHGHGAKQDLAAAAASYERACKAGFPEGCSNHAALLFTGRGVAPDRKRAEELADRACNAGLAAGCNNLGVAASGFPATLRSEARAVSVLKFRCRTPLNVGCAGWGVPLQAGTKEDRSGPTAVSRLRSACDLGSQNACVNLGGLLRIGADGAIDPVAAATLFSQACERGNGAACGEQGSLVFAGHGTPKDPLKARQLFARACEAGERDSCSNSHFLELRETNASSHFEALKRLCEEGWAMGCDTYGAAFALGLGTPKNEAQAVAIEQKACEAPGLDAAYSGACIERAYRFIEGRGVPKDPVAGALLIRQTCDAGNLEACVHLSMLEGDGNGMPKNALAAQQRLSTLCDESVASGCTQLGYFLRVGKAGVKDDPRAFIALKRACGLGHPGGCALLGEMHDAGVGGASLDKPLAKKYFAIGCDGGVQWACAKR